MDIASMANKARTLAKRPSAVFAAVVLAWMFTAVWMVSRKTVSSEENRVLGVRPQIVRFFEAGYDYGGRFERWLADHFPRRKALVRQSNQLRLRGNARVLYGSDGWLFSSILGAPKVYTHADRFDDAQLETLRRRTDAFGRAAKAAGVKGVYFTFSNDKESLCGEFYPDGYAKVHPESRLDQTWNALQGASEDVTLVRFTDLLLAEKVRTEVFCRSGSHMNDLASFLVYGWLADRIVADFPSFAKVEPEACRYGRDESHTDKDMLRLGAVPFYSQAFLMNDFAELHTPTAEFTVQEKRQEAIVRTIRHARNARVGNGLRLFLLTDSFGLRWTPYLAESVDELHVVSIGNDDPFELGERERQEFRALKPNILVVNFTERFLQRLLTLEFPQTEVD